MLQSLKPSQDFSIDENATKISFPPGCIAPANSAGLAKALSSRRRPHVTAVDLQVCNKLLVAAIVISHLGSQIPWAISDAGAFSQCFLQFSPCFRCGEHFF
jgi:hypothetical protein